MLDVICGKGALLQTLSDIGFSNLEGADPFLAKGREYENGVTINMCSMLVIPLRHYSGTHRNL